jgi:putative exporter of polyketide antibiotics
MGASCTIAADPVVTTVDTAVTNERKLRFESLRAHTLRRRKVEGWG